MKIVSVVGARPEFIQATPVSRALRQNHHEILVHTGQHYDYLMSQVFFEELEITKPDYDLEVGSGSHAVQTANILLRLEEILLSEKPDLVIVRGDTNSTIAGALAASKLHIPLAHIEAGERSFDRSMPEEINRLVTDCLADVFFCVSQNAVMNLKKQGIQGPVYWVGDVMLDILTQSIPLAQAKSKILASLGITSGQYALVTIHRASNTDNPECLSQIIRALNSVNEKVIFPAHPRTQKVIEAQNMRLNENVCLIPPLSYFDMLTLEKNARLIATDSGGVQREAYYLSIPCLTLREQTEWIETTTVGWNKLVGHDTVEIIESWFSFNPPVDHPPIYGEGKAGQQIAQIIDEQRF